MSDEEPAETTPAPARPKKKKRRRAEPESQTETGREVSAESPALRPLDSRHDAPQIPAFALDFPADPELDALVAAFESGDYARVRREAPLLVKATESVAVRKAARELLKRIEPDPVAVYLLAGAALLLTFLAFWYWTHPHASP